MKKILTSILVLSTGIAVAKNIDFDTVIKWNSEVISTALTKAGFITSSNAAWDVRKTHERILDELVKKQSFSLRQATQVCLDKCNMSDFLKNGREKKKKKCPDLCEDFTNALVTVNNEFTKTEKTVSNSTSLVERQKDGTVKVYSADKNYYALVGERFNNLHPSLQKYANICGFGAATSGIVFETKNNKAIALLRPHTSDDDFGGWVSECTIYGTEGEYHMIYEPLTFWVTNDADDIFSLQDLLQKNDVELVMRNSYLELFNVLNSTIDTAQIPVPSVDERAVKIYLHDRYYKTYTDAITEIRKFDSKWNLKTIASEFTPNSLEKYARLYRFTDDALHNRGGAIRDLRELKEYIDAAFHENGKTYDLSDVQTKTPEEAYKEAKAQFPVYQVDENKIKCSGKCNHIPGTNDTVTCTIGNVTYKVIFDDICQTKAEEALGKFFGQF